jgi:hypothetical protein
MLAGDAPALPNARRQIFKRREYGHSKGRGVAVSFLVRMTGRTEIATKPQNTLPKVDPSTFGIMIYHRANVLRPSAILATLSFCPGTRTAA